MQNPKLEGLHFEVVDFDRLFAQHMQELIDRKREEIARDLEKLSSAERMNVRSEYRRWGR